MLDKVGLIGRPQWLLFSRAALAELRTVGAPRDINGLCALGSGGFVPYKTGTDFSKGVGRHRKEIVWVRERHSSVTMHLQLKI